MSLALNSAAAASPAVVASSVLALDSAAATLVYVVARVARAAAISDAECGSFESRKRAKRCWWSAVAREETQPNEDAIVFNSTCRGGLMGCL